MKKLILALTVMTTFSCYAQDANRFMTKDFVEQLIEAIWRKNKSEYLAGSLGEIKVTGENPVKARATFTVKSSYDNKITPGYWIEILYREGIPFAFSSNYYTVQASPIGRRTEIDELFTPGEKYKIKEWNKKLRTETRLASPTWKAVMEKWQLYPTSYLMKDKIGIVTYTSTNTYTRTESVQIGPSKDMDVEKTYQSNSSSDYYQNFSNNPVVILAIRRSVNAYKAEYEYTDVSSVIEPGGKTAFSRLSEDYDDDGESIQYIGKLWDKDVEGIVGTYMPKPSILVEENTYRVESFDNYAPSRFKKGDKITFSATGSVKLGTWVGSSTPAGIDGHNSYSAIKDFLLGALIGRIGDGEWFLIGTGTSMTASKDGILQMIVNDNDPANNAGHYLVTLRKEPGKPETSEVARPGATTKLTAAPKTAAPNNGNAGTKSQAVTTSAKVNVSSCKELSLADIENLCKTDLSEVQTELATHGYSEVNGARDNMAGFACNNERANSLMILERKQIDLTENTYTKNIKKQLLASDYKEEVISEEKIFYSNEEFTVTMTKTDGRYNFQFSKTRKIFPKKTGVNQLQVDSYTNTSKIEVVQGDVISVTADGVISVAPPEWVKPNGPNGTVNYVNYNNITSFTPGALIGKIGEKGEWFLIGSQKTFTATQTGRLILAINDHSPENNKGHFTINYTINGK